MAMTAEGLAAAMYDAVVLPHGPLPPNVEADAMRYYLTLAQAVLDYVKANADVLPGSFANSGGNVAGLGKVT